MQTVQKGLTVVVYEKWMTEKEPIFTGKVLQVLNENFEQYRPDNVWLKAKYCEIKELVGSNKEQISNWIILSDEPAQKKLTGQTPV